MDLFEKLNEKQCEAVKKTEGFVRVIAGAGSGKTKLLVSRYAYLVQECGIDSSNILCVTFTNKAAGEMRTRIRALIGPEYDTSLICTYHGFCARLLREDSRKLFLTKGFQIIDPSQQMTILEEIYQKHELKLDHASFESIIKKINAVKSTTDYVPRFCNPEPCQILSAINNLDDQIIEEFMQRQKAIYSLDFSDLMSFALYLLENDSDVREKWQDRLNYIQVDEFQDSSRRELLLVDILSGKYNNLMIVGDPDQNIYEWRGSDVKLLVDFDKSHSPTETIILNQNYRSTPQILRCANHLIEKNELRLKKDLFTNSPNGSIVTHIHSRSDEDENNSIVSNIKQLMKTRGFSYSDFAILYRSGFMSRVIEKKFVEDNIPYEIYGGVKFYQRMEILDIVAYLKLIAYDDDMSFKRIVNKPHRTFGRAKIAHLDYLRENVVSLFDSDGGNSYYQTLKNNLYDSYFGSSGAKEFVDFIENMRKFAKTARVSEIVNRVTEESGYEQYIRELGSEERLDNLAEFKRISNEFEHSFGEKLTLDEFLQQIALQSGEDEEKPRVAVKLMTIHAAKGLEFPVVFIVGMTEGIFPSSKTIEERKKLGLEEERRLCYVAITRAKEYLFIMDSEGVSEKGMRKLPSRFLFEIGEANYIRVGNISEGLMHESFKYIKRNTPIDPQPELKVGARVDHYMFGHGTIVGVDNSRLSYTIKFDNLPQTRNISKMYFDKKHDVPDTTPEHSSDEPVSNNVVEEVESDLTPEGDKTVYHEEIDDEFSEYDEGVEYELEDNALDSFEYEEVERFTREEIIEPKSVEKFTEKPLNQTIFEPSDSDGSLKRQAHTISDDLRKRMAESDNLWNRDDVPHSGWTCNGVTDLGEPCGICEICGNQIIRYVHHMTHPQYHPLDVGCICAGKMEGDIEAAKRREQDFKNRESRRENFKKRKWKESRNGNSYAKIKEHIVVLYKLKNNTGWKYSLDNEFCVEVFNSKEEAIEAAFEALEKVINPLS